jgi:hypothetical protein
VGVLARPLLFAPPPAVLAIADGGLLLVRDERESISGRPVLAYALHKLFSFVSVVYALEKLFSFLSFNAAPAPPQRRMP